VKYSFANDYETNAMGKHINAFTAFNKLWPLYKYKVYSSATLESSYDFKTSVYYLYLCMYIFIFKPKACYVHYVAKF
jgi:hypothetical protein